MHSWPGSPYPLGATWDGAGTNFALFSGVAQRVELCLFDGEGGQRPVELTEVDGPVWHGYLPGVGPGQRYGYRVHGRFDPGLGLRCNPAKLLLDPYARAIEGGVRWADPVFGHQPDDRDAASGTDSAPFVPRSVVVATDFDWGGDRPPRTPWTDTVIYEAHVRGLTLRHPRVPAALRGSYAGLAHPAIIGHLRRLGVTAVELMPVHQHVSERALAARGMSNYWGYNSIGFFAPHSGYASSGQLGQQVTEFKAMVRALHEAGIEVILDVVYNHTAEGGQSGPTLCFRGVDNAAYYRLWDDDPRYYADYTGCGNSLNVRHPYALQLVMDSLRYWVADMHVDGFRFDLAPALAREHGEVDRLSAFFRMVQQDPVLAGVKLIAEPWDVAAGGYQQGNFPPPWSEWNGRYSDTVRNFWRGQQSALPELAYRLTGSSDLFQAGGRRPGASVNYITCHDGFTLQDLVSYDRKHNEANGEENRDGTDDNRSWNCGAEGPSDDPEITRLRARQKRNLLVTLFCSQGVPMLLAGDEIGRSQGGNNNPYCQDNGVSWVDWTGLDREADLLAFACAAARLRREHPVFRHRGFLRGRPQGQAGGLPDIVWLTVSGQEMTDGDWHARRRLAVFLNGAAISDPGPRGEAVRDDSFLLLFNGQGEPVPFTLPDKRFGAQWDIVLDTSAKPDEPAGAGHPAAGLAAAGRLAAGGQIAVDSRAVLVLRAAGRVSGDPISSP
ncbi:MAG TPA: glycogen debranching protein GlgX [Streptosporangiaceae bacterium]